MKDLKKYGYWIFAAFVIFMIIKPVFCLFILGFYGLRLGFEYKRTTDEIEKFGITVEGKIIKYYRDEEGYQIPIINFLAKNGESIDKQPFFYVVSDFNIFKSFKNSIGKSIIVKYNSNNPEQFVIDGKYKFHKTTIIILILFSFALIAIGTLSVFGIIN